MVFASNTCYDYEKIIGNLKKNGIEYFLPKCCDSDRIIDFFENINLFSKENLDLPKMKEKELY